MDKKYIFGIGSLILILGFIYLITPVFAVQTCHLNIYVRDQDGSPLTASVYVDNGYLGQHNYISQRVSAWDNHLVEATRTGYTSDSKTASCSCGGSTNVYLTLTKICIPNWQCGSWSNCINGEQTRQCYDGCGNARTETRACAMTCNIEVHVHNMVDEPIEYALVELNSEKKITPVNGIVLFEGLESGRYYYATAQKSGYSRDSGRTKCEGGETKEIHLYLDDVSGNLKVHVSDCSTKEPITGATVNVINGLEIEGDTNEYGYAYFGNLPVREYEVSAIYEGYTSNYMEGVISSVSKKGQ